MTGPLLEVKGVGKRFGGFVALESIDLDVRPGERLGLIGPNGSGKSTLVNCVCGTLHNETGTRAVRRPGARRAAGAQAHAHRACAQLPAAAAVHEPVGGGQPARPAALHGAPALPADQLARTSSTSAASSCCARSGSTARPGALPSDLTQVEMRKLELARAMAAEPKLLIADEAMAGLSHSEVEDIIALLLRLNAQGITIIMIEHIMRAVMSFSQRIAVLVVGPQDRRRRARGRRQQPGSGEGLPWPVASRIEGLHAGYGAVRVIEDISIDGRRRRDRGAARHQRQRQEHADEMHHGAGAAERREHRRRHRRHRARPHQAHDRGDRRPRHRPGARRPAAVSQADGRGEPAARRLPPRRARGDAPQPRELLRDLPAAGRAARPARRQHERRRAADAGARPRADAGAEDPAGRRAVGGPRAAAGQPHHRQDQAAARTSSSSPC